MEKSFTEKLLSFLMTESLPSQKGSRAEESALILAVSKKGNPICASFGSALDMAKVTVSAMSQNEGIKEMLLLAFGAFVSTHQDDEFVKETLNQVKSMMK